jgi:DNA-binding MarR family transcriptional regulator
MIIGSRNSLSRALRSADRCWVHRLDAVLRNRGITTDHWSVLASLSNVGGITMSELARRTELPASSATRSIDLLVTRGLVVRGVSAEDRRQVIVMLSPSGHALVDEANDAELAVEQQLRAQLGDERVNELVELLQQVSATAARSAPAPARG